MSPEKARIRTRIKNKLGALSADADTWASFSYAACLNALAHPAFLHASTVLCYAAMKDELDAAAFAEAARKENKRVAFPVCTGGRSMQAYMPLCDDAWETGKYGIRTPRVEAALLIAPEEIDLVLVPGLAFDKRGGRLGRGAGYYDGYLGKTRAYRLGICMEIQLVERLPLEPHDVLMHAVATNVGINIF